MATLRVLVAEDGRFALRVIDRAVATLGHECQTAHDGVEALEMLERGEFQVLITDWDMPRMDGLELCRRVRRSGIDNYTYVIMLTAHDQAGDKQAALEAGADDFLTKPLDPVELAARLRVASRILTWENQLRAVNDALLQGTRELARTMKEIDTLRMRAEYEAGHDALTGALNRRAWFKALEEHPPAAIAVVDIDHFKRVNDTFGHPAGDAVLRDVCDILASSMAQNATVGRVGGEEFGIAFHCPLDEAMQLAESVRLQISGTDIRHAEHSIRITVSAGVAQVERSVIDTYRDADEALYAAKRSGRDRIVAAQRTDEQANEQAA